MNVQLLILLAFCAFTHASPTVLPTGHDVAATDSIADVTLDATVPNKDLDVITGLPSTHPMTAEQDVVGVTTAMPSPQMTTGAEEPVVETETLAPVATEALKPLITDAPAVETAPTAAPEEAEVIPHWTEAVKANTLNEVVVEDNAEEGLSSGQVVGIVIGALLAVIIIIAVVIAVVRRMGKYSSARSKKTAKKESPLKKNKTKDTKQREPSKFWKV
ncbi:podoplanin [Corythoichthys intestinalis]|uniref:podoplanin n=1 Tax=Corythoichthys intestinalis TaxID=161448 RepID=UPI0025A650EB|nr:podoplanin [Corythoichthys intestinalis]